MTSFQKRLITTENTKACDSMQSCEITWFKISQHHTPLGRVDEHKNIFFPATIRLWNNLPWDIIYSNNLQQNFYLTNQTNLSIINWLAKYTITIAFTLFLGIIIIILIYTLTHIVKGYTFLINIHPLEHLSDAYRGWFPMASWWESSLVMTIRKTSYLKHFVSTS